MKEWMLPNLEKRHLSSKKVDTPTHMSFFLSFSDQINFYYFLKKGLHPNFRHKVSRKGLSKVYIICHFIFFVSKYLLCVLNVLINDSKNQSDPDGSFVLYWAVKRNIQFCVTITLLMVVFILFYKYLLCKSISYFY